MTAQASADKNAEGGTAHELIACLLEKRRSVSRSNCMRSGTVRERFSQLTVDALPYCSFSVLLLTLRIVPASTLPEGAVCT